MMNAMISGIDTMLAGEIGAISAEGIEILRILGEQAYLIKTENRNK